MKKIIVLLILFVITKIGLSQNFNWIIPNQLYLKMYVVEDGIYRINKTDFLNSGINPNVIDPRTVKVMYKGVQVPIYFYGEEDGIFNDSDYFDFYGQRNYGGITNTYYESSGVLKVGYVTDEYFNLYSDTNVYWVNWGGTYGLRYSNYTNQSSIDYPYDFKFNKLHFEVDSIYSLGETTNPNTDFRYFNTEKVLGEGWYWKELTKDSIINQSFYAPNLYTSPTLCSLKIFAYPNSASSSIFNEHRLIIAINSTIIDTLFSDGYKRFDTTIIFQNTILSGASLNQISFRYTNPDGYKGYIYFDCFTLTYPEKFIFTNNLISYKSIPQDTSANIFKVKGYNTNQQVNIYDIRNNLRITGFTSSSDTLRFTGKGNGIYEIANDYISRKPFRIKQKQVPDLLSTGNGTDYLIVYNKIFETQAEQLSSYRSSHNSFRSYKAEIEDIYDIFNYGIENPIAVRYFVKYVYDNWQFPKVRFLTLFGRGSLDPKKNQSGSVYYRNLVPVYGNPNSDGYFGNVNLGSYTYTQNIAVGRLPAYTVSEADDMVNKIISYESQQLQKWIKQGIFITGGMNRVEQILFAAQSDQFINTYITPPSVSGFPIKIYRNDSTGGVTFNYRDSIKNAINAGGLLVNYIGHASFQYWDNGMEDPSVLNNGNLLPLIFSMTCFTGKNADPSQRIFGEKFIYLSNKGAIGFIGTTGWSFTGTGNTLNGYMLQALAQDTVRYLGEILKYAGNIMTPDSISFVTKHVINCYCLSGDPASRLLLPDIPEFDIQLNDYTLLNPFPSLYENIGLVINPKNLGTHADSCKIRYKLLLDNHTYSVKDTVIYNFGFIDTLLYNFRLDTAGNYVMNIILDPDNWYPEEDSTNNKISFPIFLKNISFIPLKPIDNSVVKKDTIEITGLNPSIADINKLNLNYKQFKFSSIRLLLQLDTSIKYNSPLLQTFFTDGFTGVTTKFKYKIPILDTNTLYYWRMNSIINGDSTGWSDSKRFLYNNYGLVQDTRYKNIKHNAEQVTINKRFPGQYSLSDFHQTEIHSDSIKLSDFTGSLTASSFMDFNSYFISNNIQYNLSGPEHYGLTVAKIRKVDGLFLQVKNFRFSSITTSDSLINFLNTFDTTDIAMFCKGYPLFAATNMSTAAKNKIKEFGSSYIDSVIILSWTHWSFISYKKEPGAVVSEAYSSEFNLGATSQMSPLFMNNNGYVNSVLGPAESWKYFSWEQYLYPLSFIKIDIYGISKEGNTVLLYSDLTNNNLINIDTVNSHNFPYLKLNTKLTIDTVTGYFSPVFKSLKFNYYPPPEVLPDIGSVILSDSVVQEGDTVRIQIRYYNVGYSDATGIVNKWYVRDTINTIKTENISNTLMIDSSFISEVNVNTSGLRTPGVLKDTINIYFQQKLTNNNELFEYNNIALVQIIVTGDTLKPNLEITYDGIRPVTGDLIQSNPDITVKYIDEGKMVIRDTIRLFIDGIQIPPVNVIFNTEGKDIKSEEQVQFTDYIHQTVFFKPSLSEGNHRFSFKYKYKLYNNIDYKEDSVIYILNVNPQFRIVDIYNYPNPMKDGTTFMFNISGASKPSSGKIKIFTVAGRVIKEINYPMNIGFNQIFWDGRDSDGDYIANGIYFYKIIVEGDSKKETATQKLVVLK